MFERFSPRARQVMVRAQEQAQRLGRDYIGTEHVLLSLLTDTESAGAAAVLGAAGVETDTVATRAEALTSIETVVAGNTPLDTAPFGPHMPFTPQTRQVCDRAFRFTLQYAHPAVEPEHLLLAVAGQNPDSNALRVLLALAVDIPGLRAGAEHALPGTTGSHPRAQPQQDNPAPPAT